MFRQILSVIWILAAFPAWSECLGRDLMASLPQSDLDWITQRAHAEPFPDGIYWRATKADQEIHLLGTTHFFEPRHQLSLDLAEPAIQAADFVFLEATSEDQKRLQTLIATQPDLAFYVSGPTLPDRLPEPLWQKLRKAMADRGTPGFMTAKMRPWMALVSLGISKCIMQEVAAGRHGLDHMVGQVAEEAGKEVLGLEPFDTVLHLFDGYTEEEIIEFLRINLALEQYDPDDQYRTLAESYFRGEIRVMWEFAIYQSLKHPEGWSESQIFAEYERLETALIGARNQRWMERILPSAELGSVFLAAGALHLPGKQGLLALLEAEGFSIERLH